MGNARPVFGVEVGNVGLCSPAYADWLDTMPSPDEAILAAHRHSHMSLSDMARALGLSVSRVSRIVAGARESRAFDRTEGAAQ